MKTVAFVVFGFTLGVAGTVACGAGGDTATAASTETRGARTVLYVAWDEGDWSGETFYDNGGGAQCYGFDNMHSWDFSGCCPDGFSAVALGAEGGLVCLED